MTSLQDELSEIATELDVPGAVAAVVSGASTEIAVHGVTNIEHPLPVTDDTLFQFGSTGKTFTATALLVLVEQGRLALEDRVRRHVPELTLRDESVAEDVTVLHLLNHTAGWFGDFLTDTGDGDDCLARYVERMAELEQVSPLGATVSYNNASLSLAGRVIEKVTGKPYERAVKDLVLTPLGLERTFGFAKDIMTYRFASGHVRGADGTLSLARPWYLPRSGAPAGGWTADIRDQVAWARFHLGLTDSTLLSDAMRLKMQTPTAHMRGSALGDAVGISWLLTDLGGVVQVSHGGSTLGQLSAFDMVPEREFAFICMTNCAPTGSQLYGKLGAWARERHLGITAAEPELAEVNDLELAVYGGRYAMTAATMDIVPREGRLIATVTITDPTLQAEGEPAEQPPVPLALLAGDGDRYVIAEGDGKGMKGYFSRAEDGRVLTINFSGRDMTKVGT
ncbi:MAG TPA: serine hydrolase domain-containing protein [Mycobacteriales bacterium]|nr:serine hydrolase domain-containing protein [Mycobacteriales bacterium]